MLTVLSVAYPFAPVGPGAVGGAERILTDLDSALVAAGHRSLVVACAGSRARGELLPVPLPVPGPTDPAGARAVRTCVQRAIDRALARGVDLVHMHGLDFHEYSIPATLPVLVTLHLPISWYPADAWARLGPNVQRQCVSDSQRASSPASWGGIPVIRNGVDLPPIRERAKANYALALGRVCPEKNVHAALDAGARAGVPVFIGGRVFSYPDHQRYFEEQVEPRLGASGVGHAFLGPLDEERKRRLLGRARCLLHPTLAPETSSLVALEALAAGTPVVAYPSGALPEIVEDGVTGFLVHDPEEMALRIRDAAALKPDDCRAGAERFSKTRMVDEYFGLYRSLACATQERLLA
jgi:glycosyltransferase involved in cell wall biosynthesis